MTIVRVEVVLAPPIGVKVVVTTARIERRRSSARTRGVKAQVIVSEPAFAVRRTAVQSGAPAARGRRVAICRITPGPDIVTVETIARRVVRGLETRSSTAVSCTGVAGVTGDDGSDAPDVPAALAAVAVKVYAVPSVSPVTVHVPADPTMLHVRPPGEAVTRISDGAFDGYATDVVTAAEPAPAVAVGVAGVQGGASAVGIPPSVAAQPPVAAR